MSRELKIAALCELREYIKDFLNKPTAEYSADDHKFQSILLKSEHENPWFTLENQKFALRQWSELLTADKLNSWISGYRVAANPKKVGLILAGNIPMVGFHDVLSVVLSNHIPLLKLSSKDKVMLPFLLQKWSEFAGGTVEFEITERLADFDAVIATGSNNTARYLEYYFKDHLSIIRKNRTSIAVLKGDETDAELQDLAKDIFRYYGLGCRNVTRIFMPENFLLDRLFENFVQFKEVINHNKYANNYEYNRAIYLLNQEQFWDNNFVMLKQDESLFSPLAVINFSRYAELADVNDFIAENSDFIQAIVAKDELGLHSVRFGEAQEPELDTYADNVDTMRFLEVI